MSEAKRFIKERGTGDLPVEIWVDLANLAIAAANREDVSDIPEDVMGATILIASLLSLIEDMSDES